MLSACTMIIAAMMTAALTGAGQVELVEFTADWCGACQQMQPVISRLEADGFSVRQLDFEQHREAAERAGVRALPTLILLVNGQEVERFTGQQTYEQLKVVMARASAGPSSPTPPSTPSATRQPVRPNPPVSIAPPPAPSESILRGQSPSVVESRRTSPVAHAMQATVRIRIDDPKGRAIGTGTIIDLHKREALVLTCGHIFRDSNGKGAIECDLFVNGQPHTVPGRMISWNMRRDVGLISITPGVAIRPIKVAGPGHKPQPGDRVFSVGCNQGSDPTIIENRVIAVNRYHGPSNLVVGGRPIDGRSGGGLFTSEGMLIGVCNAADQEEDEGLYAAIPPIHAELDAASLGFVYQYDRSSTASAAPRPQSLPLAQTSAAPRATQASPPPVAQRSPAPQNIGIAQLAGAVQDSEVICILRDRETPAGKSKVYVLEQPSTEFLTQLSTEISRRGPLAATGLRRERSRYQPSAMDERQKPWQPARPEFVR